VAVQRSGADWTAISRRAALRVFGGTALLAACGGEITPSNTPLAAATGTAPPPTAAAMPAAPTMVTAAMAAPTTAAPATTAKPGAILITDRGAKLPTGPVTLRWLDNGDQKGVFLKQVFAAYKAKHPNITVEYQSLPGPEIQKIVPLGVQSGNAPDVYMLVGVPAGQAVRENWLLPLDDVIPDFAAWKKALPFGLFLPGVTDFNGKTYLTSFASQKRFGTLMLYNTKFMREAGYDPAAKPLTWDEFRAANKKITQNGKGQYFGTILGGNTPGQWELMVRNLARVAGAAGSDTDINWKTGEYNYTSDQYLTATELVLAMKADGSIFPGVVSLNAPQARDRFAQGVAGTILQGPWNIPLWQEMYPNFDFGVAEQPVPNSGTAAPITVGVGGANHWGVYAKSPNAAVAGDLFHYLGTVEGQRAWAAAVGSGDPPIMPQATEGVMFSPREQKAIEIGQRMTRFGPNASVRNSDIDAVAFETKAIQPNFGETIQGLFSGQLKDAKAALADLQNRANAELERAIKAAQGKGAKIFRDDYKFPNWDPAKDYGQADYDALKKA